jgi:hypothetical protein
MCSNVLLKKSPISIPFVLSIIKGNILSNFENEWCTFDKIKKHLEKKSL